MEVIISLFMLFLQSIGSFSPESVSFYFSVYENRALYTTSTLIQSTFAKDVMLCARACGAEPNCSTANYNSENNKCELFKERKENVLHRAAVIATRGCYLLTKVTIHVLLLSLTALYNYVLLHILDTTEKARWCL